MLLPVGRLISRRWSCHLSHEHSRAQHEKNCRTDGVKYSVQLAFAPINRTDAGTIGVTGKTYLVTVKSSFRTTFTDCFRFDVPAPGELSIDGLGESVIYRYGQLWAVKTSFKAVSLSGEFLSIMFYGEEVDALKQLNGEGVNEYGDTFVFTGLQTATCVSDAVASRRISPYRQ